VQTVAVNDTIVTAACRMRDDGVGTVVVLDGEGRPQGILTDRDVALRVCAEGRNPLRTTVGETMTTPVDAITEDTAIDWAVNRMAERQVRRLVVVDDEGVLVGLLSMDDVLELLTEEVQDIGSLLRRQMPA
jgi:CBS domain-containing protein